MAGAGGFGASIPSGSGASGISNSAGVSGAAKGQTAGEKAASQGKPDPTRGGNKSSNVSQSSKLAEQTGSSSDKAGIGGGKESSDDKEKNESSNIGQNVSGLAAVAAAGPVMQATALAAFLKYMKFLFAQAMALASNLWAMFVAGLVNVGKAIAGFFVGIGQAVSGFVGGAISATAAGITAAAVLVTGVIGGSAAVYSTVEANEAGKHDAIIDCDVAVDAALSSIGGEDVDVSAQQEATAKMIYGALSAIGLSDEHIAGMLGNAAAESGVDPTTLEYIYDEPYQHGPRGKDLEAHDFDVAYIAPDSRWGYHNGGGERRVGIGLWQWTDTTDGAVGTTQLVEFAKAINKPWYETETQLAFLLSESDQKNPTFKQFMAETFDDPTAAAMWFRKHWERNTVLGVQKSETESKAWYARMGGWEKNQTLANSILALAGTTIDAAGSSKVKAALSECLPSTISADNSSIARAGTSYAWPVKADGEHNDGTDLYMWLHKEILPGDPYFASCDRSVTVGIRWSGSDDTFVPGPVSAEIAYVTGAGKDKWTQVTEWKGDTSVLQPGDIFMKSVPGGTQHIVMYVGEEIPTEIWGDKLPQGKKIEIMHGSLNNRSPTLDAVYPGLAELAVWRLTNSDDSDKYRSLTPPSSAKPNQCSPCVWTTPSG